MTKYIILFAFSLSCVQAMSQDREVIDKVVGIVGNELILLSDIEDQFALIEKQRGVVGENLRCDIMDNMLAQNLMLNQARLDSIEVGEEEVEAQLNARIEQILAYMNNDPKQFEDYYGATINEVKEQFREDLRNKILIERMQSTIINSATVTPSEVKEFFNRIPTDSLPYFSSEVEVAEIVYKPKVNAEQKKIAREKLELLRKRITEDGEDFGSLAKLYSDDLGSAQQFGDLGWARRGQFVPEFEAAAYSLENGVLSSVVETEYGFHLIEMIERRGNSIHTRHILIKPEITQDDLDLAVARMDSIRKLMVEDSVSFNFMVKRYSDEDIQSYSNGGNLVNPKTGNTFFEIADLDTDIYFTLDTMEVGEISAPFPFKSGPGETAYRMVLLKSRTKPHRANLKEDYSKIKLAALESKKNIFMNNWVEEKIGSSFIAIDQLYQSCPALQKWMDNTKP